METILVKPKNRDEQRLVAETMKRMGIETEVLADTRNADISESDFAADFELNVEEVKSRWPRMKNLQRTRELLYELMRSGYARLQKI